MVITLYTETELVGVKYNITVTVTCARAHTQCKDKCAHIYVHEHTQAHKSQVSFSSLSVF